MPLTYSEIMIRYGELSTKGKNRMRFINKLRNNISDVLSIYPAISHNAVSPVHHIPAGLNERCIR